MRNFAVSKSTEKYTLVSYNYSITEMVKSTFSFSVQNQSTVTTNDIVINKLTQILSYLRQGVRANKRSKKKEKDALKGKNATQTSFYAYYHKKNLLINLLSVRCLYAVEYPLKYYWVHQKSSVV